ncbi:MAG: sugar phosphate nucleotidyltransferase, partial [Flavobacteriales bacterium]|nr:sugar phosphate nucleotidyltransferase [Flavobacteriales bacterium]
GQIAQHVGGGFEGEKIHYVLEEEPLGVGHALNLARSYNQDCRLLVYFSDNITTLELTEEVNRFNTTDENPGCVLLAREEAHPEAFGVAVLDENGNVSDIIEKPKNPPSNLAIGGIYLFDENLWTYLDTAMSQQGEDFSISDVIRQYIQLGNAKLLSVGEETWVDCGTPETLLLASQMAKDGKLNPEPHR